MRITHLLLEPDWYIGMQFVKKRSTEKSQSHSLETPQVTLLMKNVYLSDRLLEVTDSSLVK